MDKVDVILKLISEKTKILNEDLEGQFNDVIRHELISQIVILEETYNEVKLIQKQDD